MNLLTQLKRDEGTRHKPYRDSRGIWTIGCGRNLQDNGISLEELKHMLDRGQIQITLTQDGIDYLLNNDIYNVLDRLNRWIPWYNNLSEVRRGVLQNMAFQLGAFGLMEFKKFLKCLEREDFQEAGEEMMRSKWAQQTPERAERLREQLILDQWT